MKYGLKTVIAIALAVPLRLDAQVNAQRIESTDRVELSFTSLSSQNATARAQFWSAAPATIGGSALGLIVGAPVGFGLRRATGCCFAGGDDPGLAEGLVTALAGATVGSAVLGWLSDDLRASHSLGRYARGAAIGILPGLALGSLGAWAFDSINPDLPLVGFVLGFSVGQGTTAALVGTRGP